jgi:hypothetical protein
MRPTIATEHGKAESETTFMRESGHNPGSRSFERNSGDVSESFHDPGQLCLLQIMQPSAAKQIVPVTRTVCSHPLYIAFCKPPLDGCLTYNRSIISSLPQYTLISSLTHFQVLSVDEAKGMCQQRLPSLHQPR